MFCAKCGTENLEEAKFCRGCGAPLAPIPAATPEPSNSQSPMVQRPQENPLAASSGQTDSKWPFKISKKAMILLLAGFLVVCLAAVVIVKEESSKPVGARELAAEYSRNPAAFNKKYKDEDIVLIGTVGDKGMYNNVSEYYVTVYEDDSVGVNIDFSNEKDKLKVYNRMKEGQAVRIKGNYKVATPQEDGRVLLEVEYEEDEGNSQ